MVNAIERVMQVIKKVSAYELLSDDVIAKIPRAEKNYVIGFGKAAPQMLDRLYQKLTFNKGIAFTKYGHSLDTQNFKTYEASHPILDMAAIENGEHLQYFLAKLHPEDQLVVCLSGGASAICEIPNDNVSFEELQRINMEMIFSRMPIHEINARRKKYSKLKGGGLINLSPTKKIHTLAISDISFDDIWAIGSGPTESTKYPNEKNLSFKVVGDYETLRHAAQEVFQDESPYVCETPMDMAMDEGIAYHIDLLKHHKVVISGGELTLEVTGTGMGGRNMEFVLRMAKELFINKGIKSAKIVSVGTDGTDGPTDAAGAWIDYDIFMKNQEIEYYLENNDTYAYFEQAGTLIKTGPTATNIMDLRYIRVD